MYKSSRPNRREGNVSPQHFPLLLPNPFLLTVPNATGFASAATFATRWLTFVSHRLGEDVRLAGELAASKSPFEFWGRHADFLLAAAQDYGQAWGEFAKLAGANLEDVAGGPEHAEPDKTHMPPVARAA